jgi:hypothetical protein
MKKTIQGAATVVAAIPGFASLFGAFTFPAEFKNLFVALATAVLPALIVLLIMVALNNKPVSARQTLLWAVGAGSLFAITLILFLGIYMWCVVVPTDPAFEKKPVLFPLWLSGDIAQRSQELGGRLALVNEFGPDAMVEHIQQMPWANLALWLTVIAMIALYATSAVALVSAFAIPALFLAAGQDGKGAQQG